MLLAMASSLLPPSTTTTTTTSPPLAWSVEWIPLDNNNNKNNNNNNNNNNKKKKKRISKITPPRSGHVAFGLHDKVYVFGGYVEESPEKRYPTNEMWVFDNNNNINNSSSSGWQRVRNAGGDVDDDDDDTSFIPQQRLAAAAVTCQQPQQPDGTTSTVVGLLLGGWDSQEAGTGGVILQDLQLYYDDDDAHQKDEEEGGRGEYGCCWKTLPFDLQQPTSRLCAVTLPDRPTKVLVHNHRCTDHVLLVDLASSQLIKQPTSGTAAAKPSPRGLHACVCLPNTHKMVLFGGAAQDGNMSNQVFVLDTQTWTWQQANTVTTPSNHNNNNNNDNNDGGCPTPRASPCLVAVDAQTCILFGGASRSEQGLHGCSDTWLLQLIDDDDDNNNTISCQWTQLNDDGAPNAPPGRNAATLTPLPKKPAMLNDNENDDDSDDGDDDYYFLLCGGWYPFRTTYNDNYVLKVTKNNNNKT
jgi:Galactose oxidase, central domain/Kelch motif